MSVPVVVGVGVAVMEPVVLVIEVEPVVKGSGVCVRHSPRDIIVNKRKAILR